ncbi:uncharacterized protein LOC144907292 isoform X35 [Branchiostoma floridae x Branchiostoma belcheri]
MVQPSKTKTMAKTGEGGSSDQQSATEPSSNSVNGDNKKDPIVPGLTKVQLPRSAAKVVLQPKKESETSASYVPKFANVNVKERFEQMRVRKEEKEAKKFEEVRKERESRDQREKHSALRKQFLKELMDSDEEEEEKKPKETPKSYVPKMRGSVRGKFEEMQKQKEEEERRRAEEERKRRIEMDRQIQQQEQESMISKQMEESDSSDAARDVEMFEKMETPTGVPSAAPPVTPSDLPAGERRSIKGKFEEIQKQKEEEARMRAEEERLRRIEMDKLQLEREAARKAEEQEVSESDGDTSSSARFQPTVTDIPTVTRGGVKGKFEAMRKAKEEERLRQMEEERQQRIQAETESLRLSIEAAFSKAEEEDVEEEPEENGLDMSPRLTKKIGSVKGRYEEMQKARDEEHRRQLELERTSRLQMEKQAIENQSETVNVDQVNGINGHSHHQQEEDEKTYTSSETITLRNRPRGDVKGRFENLRKRREEEARRKTQEIRISRIEFDKMMQQREQEKKTSQVEVIPDEEEDGDSASVTSSLTSSFISDADGESGAPQPGTCGSMKSRFEALTTAAKEKPTRTAEPRVRRLKKLDTFVRDTGKDNEEENEVNDTNETTKPRKLDVKNRFEEMRKKREEAERRKTQEIRLGRLELDKIAQEREKERKEKDEVPCDDDNDDSPSEGSPSLDISEPVPSVKDRLHQIKNSTAETQRKAQELQLSRLEFDKMMQEREKERNRKKEEEEDELAGSLEDLSCEPEKPMGSVKGRFEELRKVREEESRRKAEEERLRRLEADRLAQERELEKQAQQESASQANEEEAEDKPEVKEDIPTPKRGSLRGKFEVMQRQKEEEARKKAEEERLRRLEDEKKILAEEAAKREAEYEEAAAAAAASEGGDQEGEEPAESAPEESGPRLSVKERFAMMQKKKEEEEEQRKLKTADVKEAGKNKRASALFEKFQNIDKVAEEERLRKVEEERARRLEMDREMLARELERTEKMVGLEEEAAEEAQEEEEEEPKAAETDEDRAARKQRTRALFSRFENLESYEEQERRRRIEEEKRKRLMLEQREIDEARRKEVGGAADVTGTEELKREEEAREREYMERYARGEASDVDDSEEDESLSATSETLAPKFVKNFENMTIYDGDPVRFEAKVIGRPKPDVTWYLNGKRLPNNQDYRYKFEGDHGVVLELPETFPEDEGEYMCKAVNTSGMALCSALLIIEGKGHRAESSYIKQTVQQPPRSAQPKAAAMKTSGVKQPTGNQPKHSNVQPSMQQPKQKQVGMQPKQGEISPGKSEAVIKEQVVSKSEKITSTTSTGHFVKKSSSTTSEKVVTKTTEVSSSSKPAEKSAASAWELKYGGKPLTAQQLAKQKLAQKMAGKPPSTSVKVPVQKLYVGGKAAPAQTVPPKAPQSQGEPRPTEPQPGAARKQWPPPTKAR